MIAFLVFAALFSMAVAGGQYISVYNTMDLVIPAQFRRWASGTAIDIYVWNPSVPASLRRQYLGYLTSLAVAFGLIAGALFLDEQILGTLAFAGVSLFSAGYAFNSWFRHRGQF